MSETLPLHLELPLGPCIEVPGSSTSNGIQLDQWGCGGQTNEQWYFQKVRDDLYRIRNRATDKCMSIASSDIADGAAVVQWDCVPRDHEYFRVLDTGRHDTFIYYLIQNAHSNKCIDNQSGSLAPGVKLTQWTCTNVNHQQVRLY